MTLTKITRGRRIPGAGWTGGVRITAAKWMMPRAISVQPKGAGTPDDASLTPSPTDAQDAWYQL